MARRISLSCSMHYLFVISVSLASGAICCPASGADQSADPVILETNGQPDVAFWLESSLHRVFPHTPPGAGQLQLLAARNSRLSFQACLKNQGLGDLNAECAVLGADKFRPRIRYVRLVPVHHLNPNTELAELDSIEHLPGLVPDYLVPLTQVTSIGPTESRSFWITIHVPADIRPGRHEFQVKLSVHGASRHVVLPVTLDVGELVLQPRRDFPVIHWWRGEATWDYYRTEMFDERWWALTRGQLENMLAHGSDVVYVPIFFSRRETFARPCQLLVVNEPRPGEYEFDWTRVRRFVRMCQEIGFCQFEWSHLWIYWGVENPIRVYTERDQKYVMLWPPDTQATSETYLRFLRQFLPAFHQFLTEEKILETSYFHLSDEPGSDQHVENYRRARQVLRELAPWMKVLDALSDVRYGKEGLTDMPIPLVSSAQAYIDAGIPMIPYGDPFMIYPGPDGPLDSIRWEVFAESLQDYALLQTAGISADDPLLVDIKSYADFPKREEWITQRLRQILKVPEQP